MTDPARIQRIADQPSPTSNASQPIWELVIADMRERDHVGRARYGTPLQANNGRDPLIDAYQEALDLAVYLRQAIAERASQAVAPPEPVAEVVWEYEDDPDIERAVIGPITLSVWPSLKGGWGWTMAVYDRIAARTMPADPAADTIDAAKAAAIAAARAWRDSIRL